MGQNIKFRLLESIGRVYEQAKDCKLHTTFFEKVDAELNQISDYFKVSRNQSLIIAMVFAINYKGYVVEINDLTEYFNCNPIKLLEFSDDFNALHAKGILKRQKNQNQIDIALSNEQFTINEKIAEAILNGKPLPLVEHEGFNDVYELLETFSKLWGQRRNEEISTFDLFDKAKKLVSSNLHIPLIKRIGDYELSIEDTCIYIYLIWNTVLGIKNTVVDHAVQGIFENTLERVKYYQKFMSDDNKLINNNLIEIIESGFLNDTEMKLSAPSIKMLQECGIKLFANQKKPDNIIEPEKIVAKKLYFNEFEAKQVDLLKTLLQGDNCRETQNRLQSKGLPKGITVLLHGLPGTGKTETVFQIAKETDRVY